MKEIITELITDYLAKLKANRDECIELMKQGKEWKETAAKGAGIKMMIEHALLELKKYQ